MSTRDGDFHLLKGEWFCVRCGRKATEKMMLQFPVRHCENCEEGSDFDEDRTTKPGAGPFNPFDMDFGYGCTNTLVDLGCDYGGVPGSTTDYREIVYMAHHGWVVVDVIEGGEPCES